MPRSRGKRPWSAGDFRVGRTIAGDRPPRYGEKKRAVSRRAWALACHTRTREFPSPGLNRNEKRPWLACVFRVGRTIAGDRPPRYGPGRRSSRYAPFGSRCSRTTVSGHARDRGGQAPALQSYLANLENPDNPAPLWLIVIILAPRAKI